jgi:hypothetical protein
MRRIVAWGVGAVLLWGAGAALADPGDGASPGGNWFTRWFRPAPKPAPKDKEPVPNVKQEDVDKLLASQPPAAVEGAASQRHREEVKYFRRWDVCNKLREIADQNDDADLRRKAEQMEERAWAVYMERTRFLPSGGAVGEPGLKTGPQSRAQAAPAASAGPGADVFSVPTDKGRAPAREERP